VSDQTANKSLNHETNVSEKGTAFITGASAGIGMVYADRLAKRGYDLILIARRGDRLNAITKRLRAEHKVAVQAIVADLSDAVEMKNVGESIASDPRITMLVNNAGTAKVSSLAGTGKAALDAMIDVNVRALSHLSLAALPRFKERNQGVIINIGSVLSFHSLPISSVYSGTKGYIMNFTRGLQAEVAGTRVIVQLVLPATTETDMWELAGLPLSKLDQGSIMSTEECVDAALAGLDQAETVTLPSVEDPQLWDNYDAARIRLFAASQIGRSASRYRNATK
jgi:short-subunit dehydrogenase